MQILVMPTPCALNILSWQVFNFSNGSDSYERDLIFYRFGGIE